MNKTHSMHTAPRTIVAIAMAVLAGHVLMIVLLRGWWRSTVAPMLVERADGYKVLDAYHATLSDFMKPLQDTQFTLTRSEGGKFCSLDIARSYKTAVNCRIHTQDLVKNIDQQAYRDRILEQVNRLKQEGWRYYQNAMDPDDAEGRQLYSFEKEYGDVRCSVDFIDEDTTAMYAQLYCSGNYHVLGNPYDYYR